VKSNGAVDPAQVTQAVELARQTQLLHALVAEARSDTLDIAVHDGSHQELVLEKFPVTGAKRIIAPRFGNGFDSLAVPTSPGILALGSNTARLGLLLVNSGANAVILYLASSQRPGVVAVYLAASGGSWNGLLGNVLWCGNVAAVALTAPSTLAGGEI
jgi:hypothetical protein